MARRCSSSGSSGNSSTLTYIRQYKSSGVVSSDVTNIVSFHPTSNQLQLNSIKHTVTHHILTKCIFVNTMRKVRSGNFSSNNKTQQNA